MKRSTNTYWGQSSFAFDNATRSLIRSKLKKERADQFLELMARPCKHYREREGTDLTPKTMKAWRQAIERIGNDARKLAMAIHALEPTCVRLIDPGIGLMSGQVAWLGGLALSCEHAATSSPFLNPGEGAPMDFGRRNLTLACADAYRAVTGREPKTSPGGTFAQLLLAIEHAAGATPRGQRTVSAEYLQSVLGYRATPKT